MSYQLESIVKQSVLAGEKMIEIYQALECLARHSIMAPHLKAKYPEILDLKQSDITLKGGLGASRTVTIVNPLHALCGVVYEHYPVKRNGITDCVYNGLVGYFKDPEDKVLKYVRKELF